MDLKKSTSRIHIKTLLITSVLFSTIIIPVVFAMSLEDSIVLQPYGSAAILAGIGTAIIHFVQRRFSQFKRIFDIVVAFFSLAITSPLIMISVLLIKIFSPNGPVLYSQNRVGKNGLIFKIYKLRTMAPDAEKNTGAVWSKGEDDPRLIPLVGGLLRKMHVDEIPQFINVLKGDMSVVGPRPERPEFVSRLKEEVFEYERRLMVKPGITGLAQVTHRYDKTLADVKKKVKLDLLYIRRMCLFVELNILFRTVLMVTCGKVLR